MYNLQTLITHIPQLTSADGDFLNANQSVFTFTIRNGGNPNHNFSIQTEAESLAALTSSERDEYVLAFNATGDPKRKVRKN